MAVAKSLRAILEGSPIDPAHEVVNAEFRAKLEEMELQAALNGALFFEDALADLPTGAEGDTAFVLDDGTASNNGVYLKGVATWAKTADLPAAFSDAVSALADLAVLEASLADVATSGNSDDLTEGSTNLLLTTAERAKLAAAIPGALSIAITNRATSTANALVVEAASGAPELAAVGDRHYLIKITEANTSAVTLDVGDGSGALPLNAPGGAALVSGDLFPGARYIVRGVDSGSGVDEWRLIYGTAAHQSRAAFATPADLALKISIADLPLISDDEIDAGVSTDPRRVTAANLSRASAQWWAGSTQESKLAGIATGATANATDADLRDRTTHTGAQAISTVTGLQAALDGKATAAQGAKADTAVQPGNLGTAAATAATDYATAAQGAKADSAVQPGALGSAAAAAAADFATAAQGATADTAVQPDDLGTAAAAAASDFATAAQGAKADSAAQTGDLDRMALEIDRGEIAERWTSTLTGAPEDRAALTIGSVVTTDDLGAVLAINGDDYSGSVDVAPRKVWAVEAGRIYQARVAFQRIADPADPSGHAVGFRVQNLSKSKGSVSNVSVTTWGGTDVQVADGVITSSFTFGRSGAVDYTVPATCRYLTPHLRVYGDDHVLGLAVIEVEDITDISARALAVDVADLEASLADVATSGDSDDLSEGATNLLMTTAERATVGHLTVTAATDLDDIRTKVDGLDSAIVLIGAWDASAGSFPGGGTAQRGHTWIASVGGTVDGVEFSSSDRVIAVVDNADVADANDWLKTDYTDSVLSVAGRTGAVTLGIADVALLQDALDAKANAADLGALAGKSIAENSDLADMDAGRIKGRVAGGSAGAPQDLTAAEVRTTLNVADGATANAPDSALRDRTTHTGEQAIATVTDLQDNLDARELQANRLDGATGPALGWLEIEGADVEIAEVAVDARGRIAGVAAEAGEIRDIAVDGMFAPDLSAHSAPAIGWIGDYEIASATIDQAGYVADIKSGNGDVLRIADDGLPHPAGETTGPAMGWFDGVEADGAVLNGDGEIVEIITDTGLREIGSDALIAPDLSAYSAPAVGWIGDYEIAAATIDQTGKITSITTSDAGDLPIADDGLPHPAGETTGPAIGWIGDDDTTGEALGIQVDAQGNVAMATLESSPWVGMAFNQGAVVETPRSHMLPDQEPGTINLPATRAWAGSRWVDVPALALAISAPSNVTIEDENEALSANVERALLYQFVSNVVVRTDPGEVVLTEGTDYTLDAERGITMFLGVGDEPALVDYTAHPARVDLVSINPITGAITVTAGTAAKRAFTQFEGSIPEGNVPVWRLLVRAGAVSILHTGLYGGGLVRIDKRRDIEAEIAEMRRRARPIRALAASKVGTANDLIWAGYGDSITHIGNKSQGTDLNTNWGGAGRDTIGYLELFDTAARAGIPTFDFGDGDTNVKIGWNWIALAHLESTYGITTEYHNWGIGGTYSGDYTNGEGLMGMLHATRLGALVADDCEVVNIATGMNELGEDFTYANVRDISEALLNADKLVLISLPVRPNERYRERFAMWRQTCAQLEQVGHDLGLPVIRTPRIWEQSVLHGLGISEIEIAEASMKNHPGPRELAAVGNLITEIL